MSAQLPFPSVSVVVPAYNYGQFLGRAIRSVLEQDHLVLEVIIVDDGSTDNTSEVAASFHDPRLRYLHQTNSGLSAARNAGIREARHDWIAFLDADDEWKPDHLSSLLVQIARLSDSYGLLASTSERMDVNGKPLPTRSCEYRREGEIPVADIVLKTRFMPSAVMVRRDVFARCGYFDSGLRSSEDRDMWIRIGTHYRIFLQSRITVRIRKHGNNMSRQADRMGRSMSIVIRRAQTAGVVPRWHGAYWLKVWALHFFQTAWMLYDENRRAAALRHAVTALSLYPWPIYGPAVNEPHFFRLRALLRFAGLRLSQR